MDVTGRTRRTVTPCCSKKRVVGLSDHLGSGVRPERRRYAVRQQGSPRPPRPRVCDPSRRRQRTPTSTMDGAASHTRNNLADATATITHMVHDESRPNGSEPQVWPSPHEEEVPGEEHAAHRVDRRRGVHLASRHHRSLCTGRGTGGRE